MGKCVTARQMILSEDRKVKKTKTLYTEDQCLHMSNATTVQSFAFGSNIWKPKLRNLWILTAIWTTSNTYSTELSKHLVAFPYKKRWKTKHNSTALLQNTFVFCRKQEGVSKNTVNEVRFVLPLNQRPVHCSRNPIVPKGFSDL